MQNVGPLTSGRWIQVGGSLGFFVPESDYQLAQLEADLTGRVQFLGVTRDGRALAVCKCGETAAQHGNGNCCCLVPGCLCPRFSSDRDRLLSHPDSAGVCAWITPKP